MITTAPIPFTLDKETHTYKVDGQYVLATSDVISMNGLSNMGAVPQKVLDHASWRGDQLHKAVELFEQGTLDVDHWVDDEIAPYLTAYMKFRNDFDFEPIPPYEKSIVYQHQGTEFLIGATIDLRGLVKGVPCVVDLKSCFQYTGAAKKQLHLRWRLQTQSYIEADEEFIESVGAPLGKMVIHCHKDATYTPYDFSAIDDSPNWDSAIRLAMLKLGNGYKMPEK